MPDFVANNVFAEKKNDLKNRRDFSIRCEIGLAAFTANTNGYKINIVETFVEHKFDQATSTNKLRSSLLAFVRAASNTDVAKSYQLPAPNVRYTVLVKQHFNWSFQLIVLILSKVCMPIAKQQQNIRGLSEQEKNQEEAKGVPQFNFDDMVAADAETDLIF